MSMYQVASLADKIAIEEEMPFVDRFTAKTLYQQLRETEKNSGSRPAMTFQLKSGTQDKSISLTWSEFRTQVTQAANLLRKLGIGEKDVVAYILPNCLEATIALMAGATAGIVSPINPLLPADQIASILRETGAKAVITLAPFPKTDVAQKVAEALVHAPDVKTLLQVDLKRYLTPPLSWIIPLIRPKIDAHHQAKVLDFNEAFAAEANGRLSFEETGDRIATYFHTGGTTGMPKVAQHKHSGILYNGWCGRAYMFTQEDVLICPLPMFHVLAAYPVFMSCLTSGAQMVMITPQGYRGEGVFDNFWKLIERYKVTFLITVPTAAAKLMQHPIDADVSSLRFAISGSAPLPKEIFNKFETSTGVTILEGYGMTEATCLVSINPPFGERKIGSVGLPFPYSDVRILDCDPAGNIIKECGVDEIGEICVSNPGVLTGETYIDAKKNEGLFADGKYLRTGDLGRFDADHYLWITGRAKDLIIRGGHNIDPATIEDGLLSHEKVAFVGAIGQPDAHSGELPCAYVELIEGASVSIEELNKHAVGHIGERAAHPKYIEILPELPKTAVGKVFKPDLRKRAISRVYGAALEDAGLKVKVAQVVDDKKRGLVAVITKGDADDAQVQGVLGKFSQGWEWQD